VSSFSGFPRDALGFFGELEADNTRAWWLANKERFEVNVRAPMLAFTEAVDGRYRPMSTFRPNRDVRFSKDKSPYKTNIGAVGESDGGAIFYVHLDARGLMAAAGYYIMASDQLGRYRAAVDADRSGEDLVARAAALAKAKLAVVAGGEGELKTAPRGYPRDHPRIDWLRRKGLIVSKVFGTPGWIHSAKALDRVQELWAAAAPLNEWLDAHVGPSTLAPEELLR